MTKSNDKVTTLATACYEAATEEVSDAVTNLFKNKITWLQFVELLGSNSLNIALATMMLSKYDETAKGFLSALTLQELKSGKHETSVTNALDAGPVDGVS